MTDTDPTTDIGREQPKRWRDVLPIHPAAELFPLMSECDPQALRELADDIDKNDLHDPVVIYRDPETGTDCLLDGRNRLDAMELLGQGVCNEAGDLVAQARRVGHDIAGSPWPNFDPYTYVVSQNLHRRHLTTEQRKEVAAKLLVTNPAQSNRLVAKATGIDHKTVAAIRAESEATGEIPHLEKTTGTDGRARPAHRTVHRPTVVQVVSPRAPDEIVTVTTVEPIPAATIDIDDLRTAWSAVALQAVANNKTTLRGALENLITEASAVLKVLGGLQ